MYKIEFLYPYVLLLLALYLFCQYYCRRYFSSYFSNVKVLKNVIKNRASYIWILRLLIVISLLLALSMPLLTTKKRVLKKEGYDIALLLDASDSMQDNGKFKASKEVIAKFLDKRKNDRASLIVFADYALIASALTYNKNAIKEALKYIKVGVAGSKESAIYESLYLAAQNFSNDNKNKIIILLTDGLNSVNSVSLEGVIKKLKSKHIRVYTIAISKDEDYKKEPLVKIAKSSGGDFFYAKKVEDLAKIYNKISAEKKAKIVNNETIERKYLYKYPLVVAFVFLLIYAYYFKSYLVYASAFFTLIAIVLEPNISKIEDKRDKKEIAIAFDISLESECKDIYPSRLEFAKNRVIDFLDSLNNTKVSLFAFSNKSYLISASTKNYDTLKYLINRMSLKHIDRDGVDILQLLKGVNKILKEKKELIVLTSGGREYSFNKEIEYAKKHNIKVNIYAVATKKGDIVKVNNNFLRDKDGNILISRLNDNIKHLAYKTKGKFVEYSIDGNGLKKLVYTKDSKLYYKEKNYFLIFIMLSFILFMAAVFRRKL